MSKEFFCKACKSNRCADCKGFRNGNRKLPCLCRHKDRDYKPPRTPQKSPLVFPQLGMDVARLVAQQRLPPEVSLG